MRPTGKLHLGHFTGALESWVEQQNLLDEKGSRVYETSATPPTTRSKIPH